MYALTWSHSHHFWQPVFKLTANRVGAVKTFLVVYQWQMPIACNAMAATLMAKFLKICQFANLYEKSPTSCGILHARAAHVFRQSVLRMRVVLRVELVRRYFIIDGFAKEHDFAKRNPARSPIGDGLHRFTNRAGYF